jgi:hypothetical protein
MGNLIRVKGKRWDSSPLSKVSRDEVGSSLWNIVLIYEHLTSIPSRHYVMANKDEGRFSSFPLKGVRICIHKLLGPFEGLNVWSNHECKVVFNLESKFVWAKSLDIDVVWLQNHNLVIHSKASEKKASPFFSFKDFISWLKNTRENLFI